ncbi:hypothetical protein ACFE04_003377 [Oxalis oulophora]
MLKFLYTNHKITLSACTNRSNLDSFISSLIASTCSCSSVSSCCAIHARVIKSTSYNEGFIGDQLVSKYLQLGNVDQAYKLFDEIPHKDLVSWNSFISGFSRRGSVFDCVILLYRMRYEKGMQTNEVTILSLISVCKDEGALNEAKNVLGLAIKLGLVSDVKVGNSLIHLYGKLRCLSEARVLFEAMAFRSLVSWNSMIAIYVQNGFADEGVRLFAMMRLKGFGCDQANLVVFLQACEGIGVVKLAESIHALIFKCGLNEDLTTTTATINLYVRLGRLDDSRKIFKEMKGRDSVAWTSMLAGYAIHGKGREAILLFERMVKDGMKLDHVTFTHLLNACSHLGLVTEGKIYFQNMSNIYGIQPRLDHYSCMVDLLGRSGLLHDAVHGNMDLGKEVAEQLFALEPLDPRNYIVLSNIYSTSGLWREASSVRVLMKHRGVTRTPGCSFIEHGNKIHRFTVGDQSHPMSIRIYEKLNELMLKIQASRLA